VRSIAIVAAAALAACGRKPAPPPANPPPTAAERAFADDPIAVLADLEDRLAAARQVDFEADIVATGALSADVHGLVHVERERVSWIKVQGWFVGQPVHAKWSSETPIDRNSNDVPPAEWADGLLIGAVRMGPLHNWAKVMGGDDPETGHGDVRTWVTADPVAWKDGAARTRTLVWTIVIDGVPRGDSELELDGRGLPKRRRVVVHFPQGDMQVAETYVRFDVVP